MDIRHSDLRRLHGYWLAKKGDGRMPSRQDIDPSEIKPLLPIMGLVEVKGEPPRFYGRLVGTQIEALYGACLTGRYLDEIDLDGNEKAISAEYRRAVGVAEPVVGLWEYTKRDGRHIDYERLILPLSADGQHVDMLMIGLAFDQSFRT